MKRENRLVVILAVAALVTVTAYNEGGEAETFGSVFMVVFAGYCALIVASQLHELVRMRLFGKNGESAAEHADNIEEV
jgi:hypothetical protein